MFLQPSQQKYSNSFFLVSKLKASSFTGKLHKAHDFFSSVITMLKLMSIERLRAEKRL